MKAPVALRQVDVEGATLCADRFEMINRIILPDGPIIAEVGVAFGNFSRALIDRFRPKAFYAFDWFNIHDWPVAWGKNPKEFLGNKTHLEFYKDKFRNDPILTFEGESAPLLLKQPDNLFDLIYIDAAHDYDGVRRDTDAALPKLKSGGCLVFNDYTMFDHYHREAYGIVHVVNDLCVNHGWRMTHFALQPDMFCDVALRKSDR